jgi:hypothetical protein
MMLRERGEREAQAMRAILEQQKKRISTTVDENRDRTPVFSRWRMYSTSYRALKILEE